MGYDDRRLAVAQFTQDIHDARGHSPVCFVEGFSAVVFEIMVQILPAPGLGARAHRDTRLPFDQTGIGDHGSPQCGRSIKGALVRGGINAVYALEQYALE